MGKIYFAIGIHNHQPVGNFDGVFERVYTSAYLPFLDTLELYPRVKFALHNSGSLHEWIATRHPEYIEKLRAMVQGGQVEIMGGAFYEPILTILPEHDRVGQVQSFADFLEETYGQRPQGAWLAERVWEQFIVSSLKKAGVRYTVIDDKHFANAGLVDEDLLGYYTTEHEGAAISVFPISERLRYLIPFRPVDEVIDYLHSLAEDGAERLLVYADDGEKFGSWPRTHRHVCAGGWLRRFLEALLENSSWIEIVHFSEALERLRPRGRIYLPDASYREMGEWILQNRARRRYEALVELLKDRGIFEQVGFCIRGGTWRNFRAKYPEAGRMYAKMLEVSSLVQTSRSKNRAEARRELYRGQCNCAYWHGIFGGLYLPHLRSAVYEKLLSAENMVRRSRGASAAVADYDADGLPEVKLSNRWLNLYVKPSAGGQAYELDFRPLKFNLLNTMARRREFYHSRIAAKKGNPKVDAQVPSIHELAATRTKAPRFARFLKYDRYDRVALIDHFLAPGYTPESIAACEYRELSGTATSQRDFELDQQAGSVATRSRELVFTPEGDRELLLTKTISLSKNTGSFRVAYLFENMGCESLRADFAAEMNFAMLSGRDPAKWYFTGNTDKAGGLDKTADLGTCPVFGIRDERVGLQVRMLPLPEARVLVHPVYSVNHSESGLEKVFQCCAVYLIWPVAIEPGATVQLGLETLIDKL